MLTLFQGLPQSIQIMFAARVIPQRISLTFQGGFVGTCAAIHVFSPQEGDADTPKSVKWQLLTHIYPEDVNRKQPFDLASSELVEKGVFGVKLVFEKSSDFFGRITVYDLQLEGETS